MLLDLSDFPTIKKAVNGFLERENRLDVLVHNAGVMTPPVGSKNKLVGSLMCYYMPMSDTDNVRHQGS